MMMKGLRVVWNAVALLLIEALLLAALPWCPLGGQGSVVLADGTFTAQADATPPYVSGRDPTPGQTGVPIDTNIALHLLDDGDGVNLASIAMLVDDVPVAPAISGTPADYVLTYNPPVDFGYSQVVNVTVNASDLAGNAMAAASYCFATEPDTTTPYVSGRAPAPGQTGVSISANIVAHILADGDGVDNATIAMTVEGVAVSPLVNGTPADYTLTYDPAVDFGYSQVVDVTIDASDLAGNVMPTVSYSFTTQPDTPCPYTSEHAPTPAESGVSIHASIVVHVLDDGEGVDAATIAMTVEGTSVSPVVTGNPADYTLTYNPPVDFGYSQVVDVTIDASDLAGNVMPTVSYSFTTELDTTPPYVSGHSPTPGETNVVIATNIVVHVVDAGCGVDMATLAMSVGGASVGPTVTGTPADYTLTYNPPVDFDYSQVVTVVIGASDLAGNAMTAATYSFATQAAPDTAPPYTSGHDPAAGATGVATGTNIVVHVVDDGDGVDMAAIAMKVEGTAVSPVITGTPADYTLTYYPPADFGYSQVVDVKLDASDLAGNAMAAATYSFTTQGTPDTAPPYTAGANPTAGEADVAVNSNIVVHALDDGDGVDVTTLTMTVDSVSVSPVIAGTPADYTLTYNPPVNFGYSRVVTVKVGASDLAGNAMATATYSFTTQAAPDSSPPYVSGRNPSPGDTGVSIGTSIVLDVWDDGDGVDITTIAMTVEGVSVSPLIDGTPAHYTLTYNPPVDFDYFQLVDVTVGASDTAGNAMATVSYSFATEPSAPPPYTSGHDPSPGATGVALDANIVVHVADDGEGVDVSTIGMTVDGVSVSPVIAGTLADYTLTYDPPVNFSHSQVLNVSIDALDLAGNAMPTYSYSFTTEPDVAPPDVVGCEPASGETGIARDTGITLHVMDNSDGVDIATLVMKVDGVSVRPSITGTLTDYTLVYKPPVVFGHSQVVTVTVDASDLAGNEMTTVYYSFATEPDSTAPYISGRSPGSGDTGVAIGANIVFHVLDAGDGVSLNTIAMTVGGVAVSPVINGTASDYTVTYDPTVAFGYSQVMDVTVNASDLAGNAMSTCSYSFTTEPDTTPPYVSGHGPLPGAIDVPTTSNIVVHVKADGDGVDVATIAMTVNGVSVSPVITGTPADYTLTYNPPVDFDYSQIVYVTVDASDVAGKVMTTSSYYFIAEAAPSQSPDTPTNTSPTDAATGVSLTAALASSAFSSPGETATHYASWWQITNVSGDYSVPIFGSGIDTTNLTGITVPAGTLLPSTTYYWRVKYADNGNCWSEWSSETSFTTESVGGIAFWTWIVCGLAVIALLGAVGYVFVRPRLFGEG